MDCPKISITNFTVVSSLLLAGGLVCLLIWPPISTPLFSSPLNSNIKKPKFWEDELEVILKQASTPDKTVIIAVVNKAYVELSVDSNTTMLDLFLESLRLEEDNASLQNHLLLAAVDQTAYNRCKAERLHCYRVVTDGVDYSGEEVYMSKDFIKMMWRRTLFLSRVLKYGYNFIFTDADVMWLRNPFLRLSMNSTDDLQISVDKFNGNPRSEKNHINTGFYYIISNYKTISLFDAWYAQKDNSTGKKEQDVLSDLMMAGIFGKLGLRVRFLDTKYFSGFCEDSKDIWAVSTVHANCCRHIMAKLRDLKVVLRDWKQFKAALNKNSSVAVNENMNLRWTAHTECLNSWKYK
ncbi:hypothetical protein SLA2020_249390 [Shorea laevis]